MWQGLHFGEIGSEVILCFFGLDHLFFLLFLWLEFQVPDGFGASAMVRHGEHGITNEGDPRLPMIMHIPQLMVSDSCGR